MNEFAGASLDPNHHKTILLVEDELADVKLIQRALKKVGLANRIDVARDGQVATDYIFGNAQFSNRHKFPLPLLILLDLKLPKITGLEFLKSIKSTNHLKRIPVIVLTSSSESSDIDQAYEFGANSYLVKPVKFSAFCEIASKINLYWLLLNKQPDLSA